MLSRLLSPGARHANGHSLSVQNAGLVQARKKVPKVIREPYFRISISCSYVRTMPGKGYSRSHAPPDRRYKLYRWGPTLHAMEWVQAFRLCSASEPLSFTPGTPGFVLPDLNG